jgi:hypothetical protein
MVAAPASARKVHGYLLGYHFLVPVDGERRQSQGTEGDTSTVLPICL